MAIAWHKTAPAFVPLEGSDTSQMRWSGKQGLPAIGARVYGGARLGWASVQAYFTEDNYLGVVAIPDAPPAYFLTSAKALALRFPNHPYPYSYHLFGMEIHEGPAQ
jgi:hypothetical protein